MNELMFYYILKSTTNTFIKISHKYLLKSVKVPIFHLLEKKMLSLLFIVKELTKLPMLCKAVKLVREWMNTIQKSKLKL